MASRRQLKKCVNNICGELFAECIVNSKKDEKAAQETMVKVLNMQDEFISRISHTEPGSVKLFYKKYLADFNARIDEIIAAIDKLN